MKGSAYAADLIADAEARIERYRPRGGNGAKAAFRNLARTLLKRADEQYLLDHPDGSWLIQVEELLEFVQERDDSEVRVLVSEPRGYGEGEVTSSMVATSMVDQPFIVDTIRLQMEEWGLQVRNQINVILPVDRGGKSKRRSLPEGDGEGPYESITLFEITPIPDPENRRRLTRAIHSRLIEAKAMVSDFRRMVGRMREVAQEYEQLEAQRPAHAEIIQESREFLRWLGGENFVFMGMFQMSPDGSVDSGSRLGICRLERNLVDPSGVEARDFLTSAAKGIRGKGADRYILSHTIGEDSTVHRSGKIEEVLVRRFDAKGKFVGCLAVRGLFTYRAIQTRGGEIPLLRRKLARIVEMEEVVRGSYNFKGIVNAFNSLPVEYLFEAKLDDVRELVRRSLSAERSRRFEVHLSLDPKQRRAFLFVVMPRQNFTDALRRRIQELLERELGANYCDHRVLVSNYGAAVLHFYITSSSPFGKVDHHALEQAVLRLSASWTDQFHAALLGRVSEGRALELYRRYHAAFSQRYQVSTSADQVVTDCLHLEKVHQEGRIQFSLYRDKEDVDQDTVKLRIYEDKRFVLSDCLPILDDFGLTVINAFTNHVELPGGGVLYLDTFRFQRGDFDLEKQGEALLAAMAAVFEGRMSSDRLNRILLPAELSWRQVDLIRAYQGYGKQLGSIFTPGTTWSTLVKHAPLVKKLVAYFETKFGPDDAGRLSSKPSPKRLRRIKKIRGEIEAGIDAVRSFNEDRILRSLANLIDATLRTSVFCDSRPEASYAFKIDCSEISVMTEPRPWREIYVHHRDVEGIHIRGGRVARGGLRWSDRPDDFRTEILGLMRTQMVKNVLIVPVGAKGGFVLKHPSEDRSERRAQADEMYKVFIHALLDVTDNIIGGKNQRPKDVVCYDDPDSYLVVAADKGTAHLSDTANAISAERSFWLGDAFASGGSNGYDHKAIGITARGAWVNIRHLFREMELDPQKTPFTVVAIGDMGGDVFGNGMIEHKTTKLLAAFNHLHIFLDPDPDPAKSYAERRRLFRAKYGGWDAYETKKISKGGGVFERGAKSIPLSPQVRKMLGVERSALSGNELVKELLKLPVDLLYNGGIGTYVKASTESHADARDQSNDAVRVDATELRARVVGEGGNLGLTQAARIEFARHGGLINTDFVDNAGGVNISDHEVNLKILFQPAIDSGKLKAATRNKLLDEVETQITSDVLDANASQSLLLSLDERRGRKSLAAFDRTIDEVCERFRLKRSVLGLPSIKEMDRRMAEGEGLTRPELATLASYVKMMVYEELVEDRGIDLEGLRPSLHNYFPEKVRKRHAAAIDEHRLGHEIALTRLTNRIVDHSGCSFFSDVAAETDAGIKETVEAYSLVSRAANAWVLKERILDLGFATPAQVLYDAYLTVDTALRAGTMYLLESWKTRQIQEVLRDTELYSKRLRTLADRVLEALDPVSAERASAALHHFRQNGVPADLANLLSVFQFLPYGLVILDLSGRTKRPVASVGKDYFALGRASGIFHTLERLDAMSGGGYYDALALHSLRLELLNLLQRLVRKLGRVKGDAEAKLDSLGTGAAPFRMLQNVTAEELGPAALVVVTERMRNALR